MSNRFAFCVMSAWDRPEPEPEPVPDTRPFRRPMTMAEFDASVPEELKRTPEPVYAIWGKPEPAPAPEPTLAYIPPSEPDPEPESSLPEPPTIPHDPWFWGRSWLPYSNRSTWTQPAPAPTCLAFPAHPHHDQLPTSHTLRRYIAPSRKIPHSPLHSRHATSHPHNAPLSASAPLRPPRTRSHNRPPPQTHHTPPIPP